jgi:hypothetical protein
MSANLPRAVYADRLLDLTGEVDREHQAATITPETQDLATWWELYPEHTEALQAAFARVYALGWARAMTVAATAVSR